MPSTPSSLASHFEDCWHQCDQRSPVEPGSPVGRLRSRARQWLAHHSWPRKRDPRRAGSYENWRWSASFLRPSPVYRYPDMAHHVSAPYQRAGLLLSSLKSNKDQGELEPAPDPCRQQNQIRDIVFDSGAWLPCGADWSELPLCVSFDGGGGYSLKTLEDALEGDPKLLDDLHRLLDIEGRGVGGPLVESRGVEAEASGELFYQLSLSFLDQAYVLTLNGDWPAGSTLCLRYFYSFVSSLARSDVTVQPFILVRAEAGCRASLIEHHHSYLPELLRYPNRWESMEGGDDREDGQKSGQECGQENGMSIEGSALHAGASSNTGALYNFSMAVHLEPGSSLHHSTFTSYSDHGGSTECHQQHNRRVYVARDSEYHHLSCVASGRLCRQELSVVLGETRAQAYLRGVSRIGQHLDHQVDVYHRGDHTGSHQLYKNVIQGDGYGVCRGSIVLGAGARDSVADMLHRHLLLSDTAQVHARPELTSDTDEVKASHGATVCDLNEEDLWYLTTRGISEARAKEMMVKGFLYDILAPWPDHGLVPAVIQSLLFSDLDHVLSNIPANELPNELPNKLLNDLHNKLGNDLRGGGGHAEV